MNSSLSEQIAVSIKLKAVYFMKTLASSKPNESLMSRSTPLEVVGFTLCLAIIHWMQRTLTKCKRKKWDEQKLIILSKELKLLWKTGPLQSIEIKMLALSGVITV